MKNNYYRGIVIVRRKEEYYFLQYLRSNFHLPIKVFQVNLDSDIKKIDYLSNYKKLCKDIYIEKEKNKMKNFFIMLVSDVNTIKNISDKNETIKKENLKEFWFEEYVIPIYMSCNFKELLVKIGAINEKEKLDITTYMKLVPINDPEIAKLAMKNLAEQLGKNEESNFEILLEKFLEFL